jgi:hypothetical protein
LSVWFLFFSLIEFETDKSGCLYIGSKERVQQALKDLRSSDDSVEEEEEEEYKEATEKKIQKKKQIQKKRKPRSDIPQEVSQKKQKQSTKKKQKQPEDKVHQEQKATSLRKKLETARVNLNKAQKQLRNTRLTPTTPLVSSVSILYLTPPFSSSTLTVSTKANESSSSLPSLSPFSPPVVKPRRVIPKRARQTTPVVVRE